jgi:glutamyl-tRNA synthetase/glutamyl-Q tRNA(Asp) synthetase
VGPIISRYAPAPTGLLHLGHVVNAIYVWGVTRALRGRITLRIEDHDRQRSRAEYDREILADLTWLGFAWDGDVVRQSARDAIYKEMLESLRARRLTYACSCSRGDISAASARAQASGAPDERRYPGTCRDRGVPEDARRVGIRVRLDPVTIAFDDLRHGPQEQRPSEQCGDVLVRDREGNWTYQFAAAVDDFAQGVTLVIRGDDLLPSTGRQIQLAQLLGRAEPPRFLHHPLIMKSPGQKLSKSDGATGIAALRAQGWTPARVIGHAAALAGLISTPRDVAADEVSSIMSPFREARL